ncbi:hypothetical protein EC973_003225 [Apophysomyces ossiformis]|uniref:Uncharacterized protein n=1 Tax=Apophysomyces ossiformis TaxID=679940 RepID=A0A8H7EU78_9FUNG|nr:hypothetical protein EC973_003225 [Apophysomyces ossiformis]
MSFNKNSAILISRLACRGNLHRPATIPVAAFHVSASSNKGVVDKAKEMGHNANMEAGKKVDQVLGKMENATQKAGEVREDLKHRSASDAVHEASEKAKKGFESVLSKTKKAVGLGTKKTEDTVDAVRENVDKASEKAKDAAKDTASKVQEKTKEAGDEAKRKLNQ